MRLGILTGGGDAPGLNAVIRAAVKAALLRGDIIYGIQNGFEGFLNREAHPLTAEETRGILHRGGTILGTTNRLNPFACPGPHGPVDRSGEILAYARELALDGVIAVGGDGSLSIAAELHRRGLPMIGVPKTIDNDLAENDLSFGFETAVELVKEALDRLHATAEAHHRIMVVETMGRNSGWIALYGGVAGGADVILLPEFPWSLEAVVAAVERRRQMGRSFTMVVVAEGCRLPGGEQVIRQRVAGSHEPIRLGGVGQVLAGLLEQETGQEARAVTLGHLQRGGSPVAFDRILGTRLGANAIAAAHLGEWGQMLAVRAGEIVTVPLERVSGRQRPVPPEHPLVRTAREIGIYLGE